MSKKETPRDTWLFLIFIAFIMGSFVGFFMFQIQYDTTYSADYNTGYCLIAHSTGYDFYKEPCVNHPECLGNVAFHYNQCSPIRIPA